MKSPIILDEHVRRLSKTKEMEAYRYAENKLFMFAGEIIDVTIRCQDRIMDQMIDLFGTGLRVLPSEDGYFLAKIKTTEQGAKFLGQQYADAIEVLM